MNTIIVAGSVLLIAIVGTIYFKIQDKIEARRNSESSEE